ncbi:MAG: nitronate monooxygenase [Actinomycetota bacterium]|nr:nitronate monooxygenase [Actinomycetota bacterium]
MEMPKLTIGNVTARLPIIQGGMAVRISLSSLAGSVAKAGGIGVIAGSGLEPEELAAEIRRAREIAEGGVVGVNIMVAVKRFAELVHVALEEGIDLVIAGAGFSRDVFQWCKDAGTPMVPIVGSERVAQLSERFGASAVIVEGVEAGGHLGTDELMLDLLPRIVDAVDLPVIGAGGIVTGADIKTALDAGASGVQMGSRFAATVESSAAQNFKDLYVGCAPEDIVLIKSPVGLPGRAIRSSLTERLAAGDVPRIERCIVCLKKCGKDFCIMDKLVKAQAGDLEQGLIFAGSAAARIRDIPTVAELMDRLVSEWTVATEGGAA